MASQKKNKGQSQQEKPALQLTSYQLVMAICALLLLMCVLFIAGIVVNRISEGGSALRTATNTESKEPAPSNPTPNAAAPAKKTEGVQVAPKPVEIPPQTTHSSTSNRASTESRSKEGGAVYVPAPPPRRDTFKAPPKQEEAKPVEEKPTPPPATVVATRPSEATPSAEPVGKVSEPAPEKPATSKESAESAPPAESKSSTPESTTEVSEVKGPFTIQVASFDAGNLEHAKEFKKSVEEKTKYKVALVPSDDGKLIRAYIGDYKDRAAADKAQQSMKKIKDFKNCFVKSLAE